MLTLSLLLSLPWLTLLGYGATRRNLRTAMISTLALCCYAPIPLGLGANVDGPEAAFIPIVVGVLGPLLGVAQVIFWAAGAPAIGFAALGVGAIAGAVAARAAFVRGWRRRAVLIGFLALSCTAYLASELLVEAALRLRAMQQFPQGFCIVSRSSVLTMTVYGQSDWVFGTHATLVDGREAYTWSFRSSAYGSWTVQTNDNFRPRNLSTSPCTRLSH